MLKLKVDIIRYDCLTRTFDGWARFTDIDAARKAADEMRRRLFVERSNGKFRSYIVDIVPAND